MSTTAPAPLLVETAISTVLARGVASSSDREAWLAARRRGITATEAKLLMLGGAQARHDLIADKRSGKTLDLSENRYVQRGNEREPVIAEWVQSRFGIEHNDVLIAAPLNSRHLATPDGIGLQGDLLVMEEIKTSKHDLTPGDILNHFVVEYDKHSKFWQTGYYYQVQWQLWVSGAARCLFVWEQHDDNWPNPEPISLEPEWVWIDRDETVITELVRLADLALAELDAGPASTLDEQIDLAAVAVLAAREREAVEKRTKETAWANLTVLVKARGESFGQQSDRARVTWKAGHTEIVEVPDVEAAKKADPALFAEVEALAKRWDAHQAKHMKTQEKPVAERLTVTAPKKEKGA